MMHAVPIQRLLAAALVVISANLAAITGAAESWSGRVVGVHDGDTFTALVDGREMKVRLHGIDAPELAQPHGHQAKQAMSALVFGEVVLVAVVDTDRYRRKVARVFVHGRDVGEAMIRTGHAWWYQRYAPDDEDLRTCELDAQSHRRGLWDDVAPIAPWDWRRTSAAAGQRPRTN